MAKRQFISFKISGHLIGLDILTIREINKNMKISSVPLAPPYIHGLMNLRGQIVTVFDLGKRLGFEQRKISSTSKIIILKDEPVGLLVDLVGDVIQADEKTVVLPPAGVGQIEEEFIEGIVKLEEELLVILSSSKLLSHKIENTAWENK